MKFKIQVTSGGEPWWEEYDKAITDPTNWARHIVESFNNTLRPGEKKRVLLDVCVLNAASQAEHAWVKQNLVTEIQRASCYDVMKCDHCEITAKRFGIGEAVTLDPRFSRAKVFQRCDTARAHLEKIKQRKAVKAD